MNIQKSYGTAETVQGKLYLVATPIGNLEDMTFRAVRILKEVDLIAAEDTRQTRKLLTHFEIGGRVISYHEHNKAASGPELVRMMRDEGTSIALVSDAGLPAISDPGEDLVRLATAEGIPVIPIPGANAALSALICSGLPTASFRFIGFLPRDKKGQQEQLEAIKYDPATLICYESPHRVSKTLDMMRQILGDRQVVMARELTKRYEEFARGTFSEAILFLEQNQAMGEYCLVVEGAGTGAGKYGEAGGNSDWWKELGVEEHVAHYISQGLDRKEAMKKAAGDRGVSKREIYNLLLDS